MKSDSFPPKPTFPIIVYSDTNQNQNQNRPGLVTSVSSKSGTLPEPEGRGLRGQTKKKKQQQRAVSENNSRLPRVSGCKSMVATRG